MIGAEMIRSGITRTWWREHCYGTVDYCTLIGGSGVAGFSECPQDLVRDHVPPYFVLNHSTAAVHF
jgi:hypothetical protein